MKRYKTKETISYQNESIPSISNGNKSNNIILNTNSNIPKTKLIKKYNLSEDNFSITLKALNDLNLFILNIPSYNDIKKTIDDYYIKNGLNNKKNPFPFISQINVNTVKIDFPNENILNGYKTYISFLKYENPLFKHIIIRKDNLLKTIKKIKLNNNKIQNILNENKEKKILVKNIIKLYQHNKLKYIKDNSSFSLNTLSVKKSNDNDKLILNYYKNQDYLRNSSPYLSEEDKRIISERENKKKFITPMGFCCSVGKYSCPPKFISNYVQMTPSENPLNYRFRPVNKLKWITKKGFINA